MTEKMNHKHQPKWTLGTQCSMPYKPAVHLSTPFTP